ncbi:MAG TPA: potassium/proton antiporter [Thermoleophilaceae bacterium]|jgi:cell volume regulation protein A
MSDGELILVVGGLLTAAIAASLAASRLRVPALLLFLALGMAIGSDGAGWIQFDDYSLARRIGAIALALILFDGGLSSSLEELREVMGPALRLAFGGTLITALVTGVVATAVLGLPPLEGMLLGSIMASTDSAAVFGLLRGTSLRRKVKLTLEGEAGFNDPVAILLVLGFLDWIDNPGYGVLNMIVLFLREMSSGAIVGLVVGRLAVWTLRRFRLPTPGLYPVASCAAAAVSFGLAETLGGSGFLAVYLCALLLGGAPIAAKQTIATFHQGLAWLAQIALFLTLGLLVFPSQLGSAVVPGLVLALVLAFFARPIATLLVTAGGRFDAAERLLLSWAGLRGAVPVVLATFAVTRHVPGSLAFFNIVFFTVLVSTLAQGTTLEPLARAFGLTSREPPLPRPLTEYGTIGRLGAEVMEYSVRSSDSIVRLPVRDLGLPHDATLNVIVRGDQAVAPRGDTHVEPGDTLHLLVRSEAAGGVQTLLERWRGGEAELPDPEYVVDEPATLLAQPWTAADGDPCDPELVAGVPVVELVQARGDAGGALVVLEDGRAALTGTSLVAGSADQVRGYASRRLTRARDQAEEEWWREVVAALG